MLSARLELCHPSPCCQRGPSPSGCGAEPNHKPLPSPTTREEALTHAHTDFAHTRPRQHRGTHPPSPGHRSSVYFPAVRPLPSNTTPPPPSPPVFPTFSTLVKVARQQRKTSNTHTPHYASEGFPDVLVYIMECAGRRQAD